MRQVEVLYKKEAAGLLTQLDTGSFVFNTITYTLMRPINLQSV